MRLTLFIFILAFQSCVIIERYPVAYNQFSDLSSDDLNNMPNEITGIYWRAIDGQTEKTDDYPIQVIILFDDFTFYTAGSRMRKLKENENQCFQISEEARNLPYFWGTYRVFGDTIQIELVNSNRSLFQKFKKVEMTAISDSGHSLTIFEKRYPDEVLKNLNEQFNKYECQNLPTSDNIFKDKLRLRKSN